MLAPRPRSGLWLFAAALLLAWACPAWAQEMASPQDVTEDAAEMLSAADVPDRYRALADSAAQAEREIVALAGLGDLEAEIQEARQRQEELSHLLSMMAEAEYVRLERISRIHDEAVRIDQRLESLRDRLFSQLQILDELRVEWTKRQAFWRVWRDTLQGEPEYPLVALELEEALERIEAVLARANATVPELLALQDEIEPLRLKTEQIIEQVAALRAGRREALLRRSEPVLFSTGFVRQWQEEPWNEWRPMAVLRADVYSTFFGANMHLVLLHLMLGLGLSWLVRRLQRLDVARGAWSELLTHPWAVAVFISTAFLEPQYSLVPPLWEVAMWGLLAGSGAVLVRQLFAYWSVHLTVYFLAAFYPLFLLAEGMQVPVPLFRLGLAAAAAVGLVFFTFLLRSPRRANRSRVFWALCAGAGMWAVVLGAEVLGFYQLARWIMHATVTSAFVIFVVGFLVVVARGSSQMLLRIQGAGRPRLLRSVGVPLVERILVFLQVVLVIAAVLVVLNIWEITASPMEAWGQFTDAGVTIAGMRITIGRLLLAGALVYFSVFGSWLLRRLADSQLYPHWELERGVGDSINSLLHYALIIVGLLLGLGALGVEMQNLAIIAGALSVGIGFGLQNVVNNFVSGLILLFERPVRVGDTVLIEGDLGQIEKIGLRSTTVTTLDRSELIVPNAQLVSEKVVNWTLSTPIARQIMPIGVAYGSDVDRVMEILREAGTTHPAVLDDPAPQALFMGFGDSALEFELRVWVDEFQRRLEVKSALLTEVIRRFNEEGIEVPFPQRDLHVRSIDEKIMGRRKLLQSKEQEAADGSTPTRKSEEDE